MKNVILIATLLLTALSYGQRGENMKKGKEKLTPQQEASIKSKKMALELDLTDQQQDKVYNILLNQANNKPAKISKEERKNLSQEERVALTEQRLEKQIAMKREFQKVLSEEQYEKFEKMMNKRKKGAKERLKKRKEDR